MQQVTGYCNRVALNKNDDVRVFGEVCELDPGTFTALTAAQKVEDGNGLLLKRLRVQRQAPVCQAETVVQFETLWQNIARLGHYDRFLVLQVFRCLKARNRMTRRSRVRLGQDLGCDFDT